MKSVFLLVTACLLVGPFAPRAAQAGGDLGIGPYETGEALFAKRHYKTALKYYLKALERNDARAHYRIGLIHEETGKDREALVRYRQYLEVGRPDDQRSDAEQRARAIEARLKAEADRTTELLERGRGLFKKGKYREAEKALLQAASRDPSRPEIHFLLGEVYMALEAYGKAKSAYVKAKGRY